MQGSGSCHAAKCDERGTRFHPTSVRTGRRSSTRCAISGLRCRRGCSSCQGENESVIATIVADLVSGINQARFYAFQIRILECVPLSIVTAFCWRRVPAPHLWTPAGPALANRMVVKKIMWWNVHRKREVWSRARVQPRLAAGLARGIDHRGSGPEGPGLWGHLRSYVPG